MCDFAHFVLCDRADEGGMLSGTGECATFERAEKVCFLELCLFQFETNVCFVAQQSDGIYRAALGL